MNGVANTPIDRLSSPRRNNFFYGKLLDELHLTMEQQYGNQKRWMLNRLATGSGVLCGLHTTTDGKTVSISEGVAIDGMGREIVVPQSVTVDPWKLFDENSESELERTSDQIVYLSLCYCERKTDFMPALVTDCDIEEPCAPSTIVEGFQFRISAGHPPASAGWINEALCTALSSSTSASEKRKLVVEAFESVACDPADSDMCVVLATMTLKADGTIDAFDTISKRSVILSHDALLELLFCLRGGKGDPGPPGTGLDPNLPKIATINWPHDGEVKFVDLERDWFKRKHNSDPNVINGGPTITITDALAPEQSSAIGWMSVALEIELSILRWRIPLLVSAKKIWLSASGASGKGEIKFELPETFYFYFNYINNSIFLLRNTRTLVRVKINCDHLLNEKGQQVDGNFRAAATNLNGDGTYDIKTGNGTPGGTFESWFFVTVASFVHENIFVRPTPN